MLFEGFWPRGTLPLETTCPGSVQLGPDSCFLWALGVRALRPVTEPAAHALACSRCLLLGCSGVGRLVPVRELLGLGHSPSPSRLSLGRLVGPRCAFSWSAGGAVVGARHRPQRQRSCVLVLLALGVARGRPGEGALRLREVCPGSGTFLTPTARPSRYSQGLLPLFLGHGGCKCEGPSSTPQHTL